MYCWKGRTVIPKELRLKLCGCDATVQKNLRSQVYFPEKVGFIFKTFSKTEPQLTIQFIHTFDGFQVEVGNEMHSSLDLSICLFFCGTNYMMRSTSFFPWCCSKEKKQCSQEKMKTPTVAEPRVTRA
jgi:hypothetical protein